MLLDHCAVICHHVRVCNECISLSIYLTVIDHICFLYRVLCHALSELCQEKQCPHGMVLEAPFNNLHDEIKLNPLSQVLSAVCLS